MEFKKGSFARFPNKTISIGPGPGDANLQHTREIPKEAPPGFEQYPLEEVIAFFELLIAEGEEMLMLARRKKKKRVVGMAKCYLLNPESAPRKAAKKSTRNPRFASTHVELVEADVAGLKSFWRLYKRRLEELKRGERGKFPAGTIQVVERFGLECLPTSHFITYEPYII